MKPIRKILLFICALFCQAHMFAQNISITFEYENSRFNTRDTLAPYLRINYVNRSTQNYYLPAVVSSEGVWPHYSSVISHKHFGQVPDIEIIKDVLFVKKLFYGDAYLLRLGFQQIISQQAWELLHEIMNDEQEEVELINFFLKDYYDSMNSDTTRFYTKEILRCPFKLYNSPSLIFLKAGAETSQMISLRDLEKTGIILRIVLSSKNPTNLVKTGWRSEDISSLPPKVGGYKLYDGTIESNCLIIDFSK